MSAMSRIVAGKKNRRASRGAGVDPDPYLEAMLDADRHAAAQRAQSGAASARGARTGIDALDDGADVATASLIRAKRLSTTPPPYVPGMRPTPPPYTPAKRTSASPNMSGKPSILNVS